MTRKNYRQKIALVLARGVPFCECIVDGVVAYANKHERCWTYLTSPSPGSFSITDLKEWAGGGVIAALNTPREAKLATQLGVPVVNVIGALPKSPVPRVTVDNDRIGELAAEHFLERGYRQLAFYGVRGRHFSALRQKGFTRRLHEHGLKPLVLLASRTGLGSSGTTLVRQMDQLRRWLLSLERPIAIFAATDYRAGIVLNACLDAGIRVPQELAVLGVNDDHTVCQHTLPPLSSIPRANREVGYHAARLLDMMLMGSKATPHEVLIPPGPVVSRASTGTVVIENPPVAQAVDYIAEHLAEPLSIETICQQVHVSRRWLEQMFRENLGCTPYRYLLSRRVQRACELLSQPGRLPFDTVARSVGFGTESQMRSVFHRELDLSPSEYRRRARTIGESVPCVPWPNPINGVKQDRT